MRRILFALMPLIAILLSACSDETPTSEIVLYDIAKLEAQTSTGSVFTLQKPLSDNEIRLTTKQIIKSDKVSVGDRVFIAYVPASGTAYESSSVKLVGYLTIMNLKLTDSSEVDLTGWDADPIWLMSAWRSGNYLNVRARLPYNESPRRLALVADAATAGSANPDLYLVHDLGDARVDTFERSYYLSFDISQLTENPDVQGFTLHLNNSNLNLDAIPFSFAR